MALSVEQLTRIAVAFARSTATPGPRLCGACVEVLGVSGAGITVMDGEQAGPLCVSNERMGALEDFQYTSGEGPCRDAYRQRLPVLIADLSSAAASRWPGFVSLADSSGICAVFAYPLAVDGATMGVLTLYQDATGALSTVHTQVGGLEATDRRDTITGVDPSDCPNPSTSDRAVLRVLASMPIIDYSDSVSTVTATDGTTITLQ